ncbi:glycosyl hydrolase family 31 [Apiospora kogelbergensis]|uniref:glycosyl hydrolase family 31 n=1 Tax=Apiospora kogelbergensis TaxID=1337665 RepID=UPI00313088C4
MLHQYERVPQHYQLNEASENAVGSKPAPAISLRSSDESTSDPCTFQFEAIRPNVFRTTFTTPQHPVPPFPSVKRVAPDFGGDAPEVTTDLDRCSREIRCGKTKAVVDWSNAPVVSLFLDGVQKPVHRDLNFRSYAVDATGIAHYSVYKKDTLHVGLGEKAAPHGFERARLHHPLYKHIPLLINVTPSGCIGTFSTSHARGTWSVGSEIDGMWGHFKVYRQAHGGLEEYLIVGGTVAEVVRSYAELAGFPLLMPRYMMGYVGGGMKYSMEDSPRACDAIMGFIKNCEKHDMPCSAFQMSSGYTVAETEPKTRNVFTWNRHRFPDPRAFTKECHEHGVRLLANVKPYVLANHPGYPDLAKTGGFFRDPITKKTAVARLWSAGGGESGEGSHIDFTSKAGYEWWYNGVKALKDVGIDAMWNDNNEYNIPSDDWQCALETVNVPGGVARNDIGLWGRALHTELMGKSSHDATLEAEPDARPFVLTRSATAGTMKYCASSWSGDNVTSWEGMKGANALALNAGFSLLQCYGHDIGGFEGPQPTPEHLVRWIQLGIHSPRFVINCYKTNPSDNLIGEVIEPWQYPSVNPIIRAAIKRRRNPPQRWTGWGHESDPTVWSKELLKGDSQYWFGDAMLVAGVYEPGVSSARVYLPRKEDKDPGFLNLSAPYQHFESGKWHEVESTWYTSIPVLARIGSAIPVGKPAPTTCLARDDPEFPNIAKDDWRGVEIFPPPVAHDANIPSQADGAPVTDGTHATTQSFANQWLEDDGTSRVEKSELCAFEITYSAASPEEIQVGISMTKQGGFEPLWTKNGITVVLPIGEERVVTASNAAKGEVLDAGRDSKGRKLWKLQI